MSAPCVLLRVARIAWLSRVTFKSRVMWLSKAASRPTAVLAGVCEKPKQSVTGRCTQNDYTHRRRCHTTQVDPGTGPVMSFLDAVDKRLVIHDQFGKHVYEDIYRSACVVSYRMLDLLQVESLKGRSVAFLCPRNVSYVVALWAIWLAEGTALPLHSATAITHKMLYQAEDSGAVLVLFESDYSNSLGVLRFELRVLELTEMDYNTTKNREYTMAKQDEERDARRRELFSKLQSLDWFRHAPAMVIHTHGIAEDQKGVVHTHASLQAQTKSAIDAWDLSARDVILHIMPVDHVPEAVGVLLPAMLAGAACVVAHPRHKSAFFTWLYLLGKMEACYMPEVGAPISVLVATPRKYRFLIDYYRRNVAKRGELLGETPEAVRQHLRKNVRLMLCGSQALYPYLADDFREITGHSIVTYYHTTETGVALCSQTHGPPVPDGVGRPLGPVRARIVGADSSGCDVMVEADSGGVKVTQGYKGQLGELQIKGPTVFKEYTNTTEEAPSFFTQDGWFRTGDTAVYEDGVFKVLGRTSVDIVKTAERYISTLSIETRLFSHDAVRHVAVFGIPDVTSGEQVVAAIVPKVGHSLEERDLEKWCAETLDSDHVPKLWMFLESMPISELGKLDKGTLRNFFMKKRWKL